MTEEGIKLYDNAFTVRKTRFGMHQSHDTEGNPIILGLGEEQVINATRFYLKGKQDGFQDTPTHAGVVGGKL